MENTLINDETSLNKDEKILNKDVYSLKDDILDEEFKNYTISSKKRLFSGEAHMIQVIKQYLNTKKQNKEEKTKKYIEEYIDDFVDCAHNREQFSPSQTLELLEDFKYLNNEKVYIALLKIYKELNETSKTEELSTILIEKKLEHLFKNIEVENYLNNIDNFDANMKKAVESFEKLSQDNHIVLKELYTRYSFIYFTGVTGDNGVDRDWNKSIEMALNNEVGYYFAALVYEGMDNYKLALEYYEKAKKGEMAKEFEIDVDIGRFYHFGLDGKKKL